MPTRLGMGAASTTDRPKGSREMAAAQERCEMAVTHLTASYEMIQASGNRHLASAQEERRRATPAWRTNALAHMRKYKKCIADAENISTKIRVLEQHIGMIREQELNNMVTDVFKSSSVAMAKSSRAATTQLRGVDKANTTFNDLLDKMTDISEAIGEAGLNEAEAESEALLNELMGMDGDILDAAALTESGVWSLEQNVAETLMLGAPVVPVESKRPPSPGPPPAISNAGVAKQAAPETAAFFL